MKYNYTTDKDGNILSEIVGRQRTGYITLDERVDALQYKIVDGMPVKKKEKAVKAKPVEEIAEPMPTDEDLKAQALQDLMAIESRLLTYKCGRDWTSLMFTLVGAWDEDKQDEAKRWVKSVLTVTEPLKKGVKCGDKYIFEDLRNQVQEIFYKG